MLPHRAAGVSTAEHDSSYLLLSKYTVCDCHWIVDHLFSEFSIWIVAILFLCIQKWSSWMHLDLVVEWLTYWLGNQKVVDLILARASNPLCDWVRKGLTATCCSNPLWQGSSQKQLNWTQTVGIVKPTEVQFTREFILKCKGGHFKMGVCWGFLCDMMRALLENSSYPILQIGYWIWCNHLLQSNNVYFVSTSWRLLTVARLSQSQRRCCTKSSLWLVWSLVFLKSATWLQTLADFWL